MEEKNINEIFKQNIIKLLKINNKTQKDLAEYLNVSNTTVNNYVKGYNVPRMGRVDQICNFFGVNRSDLIGKIDQEDEPNIIGIKINKTVNQLNDNRKIKVLTFAENELEEQNFIKEDTVVYSYVAMYGSISAGTGNYIFDNPVEQVRVQGIPPKHDLALKVNGDSMLPIFENGEIVYIKKTSDILNGQIGAFILDGEAYLKKLYNQNGKIRLVSLNKKYKDIEVKEYSELHIVGKVIL